MEELVKNIYDSNFDLESLEWEYIVQEIAEELNVRIPFFYAHVAQPYVSYSLFWIQESESKELNEKYKDKPISGNYDHQILGLMIGEPLFNDDEIRELYSSYGSHGYSDLNEIQSDLKTHLKKINQLIYGFIQHSVIATSTKIQESNGLFLSTEESKYLVELLFNWALKMMYKFDLKKHQPNILSVFGKDLNDLREKGAKMQYKINLIQIIIDQKKHNTDEYLDDYLKRIISGKNLLHLPHTKIVAEKFVERNENRAGDYDSSIIQDALNVAMKFIYDKELTSLRGKKRTISKEIQDQIKQLKKTDLKTIDQWVQFYWDEYKAPDQTQVNP